MPQSSPPVLIIRLDGIGDALALAPLLWELRESNIPVDLVLRSVNAEVFSPAAVRRVEVAPFDLRSSAKANIAAIAAFAEALRERRYECVLVATEDPGGYRLARSIGAPRRVGFANGWEKPLKTLWVRGQMTRTLYRPAGLDRRKRHECEVLFELGRGLVGEAQPTKDVAALRSLVLERDVARSQPIAVQVTQRWFSHGATFADLAALVRRIASRRGLRAIASARETELADALAGASGVSVERFERLGPWKAAIAQAQALVAPDSGATHVAGMVGTPTVAIFAPQAQFDRQVARWHPWAAPYRVIKPEGEWGQRVIASLDILLS
jgi:ADP-heptose:LPS heptosyltransferase